MTTQVRVPRGAAGKKVRSHFYYRHYYRYRNALWYIYIVYTERRREKGEGEKEICCRKIRSILVIVNRHGSLHSFDPSFAKKRR